jgi:hypothetical protein
MIEARKKPSIVPMAITLAAGAFLAAGLFANNANASPAYTPAVNPVLVQQSQDCQEQSPGTTSNPWWETNVPSPVKSQKCQEKSGDSTGNPWWETDVPSP